MHNTRSHSGKIVFGLLCLLWVSITYFPQDSKASNITTNSSPTGAAGGALTGTYPNPTLANITFPTAIPIVASSGIITQDTALALTNNLFAAPGPTAGTKVLHVGSSDLSAVTCYASTNLLRGCFGAGSGLGLQMSDQGGSVIMQQTYGTVDVAFKGLLSGKTHGTDTNCSSAAGTCGSAAAGSVTVAAAATTVTVSTTAVTANSQIFVMFDSSLGTKLGVTCNATEPALYGVTARTAATSFQITATSPITNPACFSFLIFN